MKQLKKRFESVTRFECSFAALVLSVVFQLDSLRKDVEIKEGLASEEDLVLNKIKSTVMELKQRVKIFEEAVSEVKLTVVFEYCVALETYSRI